MTRLVSVWEVLRSPLARRLIVAIIVVSSALTLCLTALQLYGEYRSELEGIQDTLGQIEAVHLKSLTQSLWATNDRDLQLQVEGIARVPKIEYIAIREGDRIWAEAGRRASRNILERRYPIVYMHRGQPLELGVLTVVASLDAVYLGLADRAFIILTSNAFKTFLVAAFAFAFFHWLVNRHLLYIGKHLRGLDLRGRAPPLMLARLAGRPPDELDEVVAAINRMHENACALVSELEHKTEVAQLLESLSRAANEAVSPEAAMEICLRRICEDGKWALGRVATFSPSRLQWTPEHSQWYSADPARFDSFMRYSDGYEFMGGSSVFINRVLLDQCPVWLDLTALEKCTYRRLAAAIEAGLKTAFAFPVIVGGKVAAFLEFFATETRPSDALFIDGTVGLASQFARIIERSRATETQARLAAIVEHSSDAIIGRALDGTVISWNAAAERMLGYTAAEVIGRDPVETVPLERRQEFTRRRNLILAGEAEPDIESVRVAKDGRRIDVAMSTAATRDESGHIISTSVVLRDISERKRGEHILRDFTARLQTVSRKLLVVQEDERRWLARELHDQVGQALTALKINLQVIERQSTAAPVTLKIGECAQIADAALQQVRTLMLDLRPPQLDELGLSVALRSHAERMVAPTHLVLHFSAPAVPPETSPAVEIVCFRIMQEALTNTLRHAGARNVWITLAVARDELELTVRDDGKGFDPAEAHQRAIHGGSIGLLSMEERVALAEGCLEIMTAPGAGTTVRATFSLQAVQSAAAA